ncbi:MAG: hypothetical protein IT244_09435 [Bacteroidia bacterium]|nr:hypothetical protein [Bacteroidia bacterium]
MADLVKPQDKTPILDHHAIGVKIERMACEICEKHTESSEITICGMNSRGFYLAGELGKQVLQILPEVAVNLVQVTTNTNLEPSFSPLTDFKSRNVVVVDDVINTGKTLMHVLKVIFDQDPNSIETAFLAKREHRSYPVKADYVGVSLATTLQEHVYFDNSNPNELEVYLC